MAPSIAEIGSPSPRGKKTRLPEATKSRVSCGGPERKRIWCQAYESSDFLQSVTPLNASRATRNHLSGVVPAMPGGPSSTIVNTRPPADTMELTPGTVL